MTDQAGDLFAVDGRAVLVTGGSRGIGLMIARGFVEAGARVFISSRKADACERAAEDLGEAGSCVALPADVSTHDGRAALVDDLRRHVAGLDVLVNNAGTAWGAPLGDYPMEAFDKVWAVNVKAAFGLMQKLLPELRAAASERFPARIINVGSVDGLRVPLFENYAYSASKAALHQLTQHLAARLAVDHITVNAIAPGPFPSKMLAPALDDERSRGEVLRRVALGRLGEARDIAGLAIFLAGPSAAWITGAVIPLDGGWSLGPPPLPLEPVDPRS